MFEGKRLIVDAGFDIYHMLQEIEHEDLKESKKRTVKLDKGML